MAEQAMMSKEEELTLHVARETVEELLERMKVRGPRLCAPRRTRG